MTNEEDVFARTLYGEARGEGLPGIKAVACVILNRVAHPKWWGITIESVCLTPWQFSCWNKNDPNLSKLKDITEIDPVFSLCLRVARDAINGMIPDVTHGANSYYDKRMPLPPTWADTEEPCAVIGHHIFYKL